MRNPDHTNTSSYPECNCLIGFESIPNSTGMCVRKAALSCNIGGWFSKLTKMKLPDTSHTTNQFSVDSIKHCREKCMSDCHCTAFNMFRYENNSLSSKCVTWSGDLVDIQGYNGTGQDLYVRTGGGKEKKNYIGLIAGCCVGFLALLSFVYALFRYWEWILQCVKVEKIESPMNLAVQNEILAPMDYGCVLKATDNFSQEIGQGGFGKVYKGTLPNGQEIAVKRLTKGLGQGDMEFKNEVSLLTRLQHRNLIKLLGFCDERDEQILVYEFVPNSSLDHFVFDKEKRSLLTWEIRCRIIDGIARGLLYLHEDSQLKIIHRDLKASNILLDADMNPKVADFGTATLFDTDETRVETKRIAGTRGYMAPEYLSKGHISAKSDVFSFGVMLLEMISGEKNNSFEEGLAPFAWMKWIEGKPEAIIDHFLIDHPRNEIIKLIQIGLLCVQDNAASRPSMSSVIAWLGNKIIIPSPKEPAFTGSQSQSEDGTTTSVSNFFTELSSR